MVVHTLKSGADSGFFFGGGVPLTDMVTNTSCIRKPQVISGGGGGGVRTPCTLPLDPPLKIREENWADLTFAKTSGTVTRDKEKIGQYLTGASLVTIPESIARRVSSVDAVS